MTESTLATVQEPMTSLFRSARFEVSWNRTAVKLVAIKRTGPAPFLMLRARLAVGIPADSPHASRVQPKRYRRTPDAGTAHHRIAGKPARQNPRNPTLGCLRGADRVPGTQTMWVYPGPHGAALCSSVQRSRRYSRRGRESRRSRRHRVPGHSVHLESIRCGGVGERTRTSTPIKGTRPST